MTTAFLPETGPESLPVEETTLATRGLRASVRYWLGNWKLSLGLVLIIGLTGFSIIGSYIVDFELTKVAAGEFNARPSEEYIFGTDNVGRDVWALIIHGIHPSLKVGLIAGVLGTAVGVVLGVVGGYYGGNTDAVISTMADIFLTIPSLLILVVLASYIRTTTLEFTALVIAIFCMGRANAADPLADIEPTRKGVRPFSKVVRAERLRDSDKADHAQLAAIHYGGVRGRGVGRDTGPGRHPDFGVGPSVHA